MVSAFPDLAAQAQYFYEASQWAHLLSAVWSQEAEIPLLPVCQPHRARGKSFTQSRWSSCNILVRTSFKQQLIRSTFPEGGVGYGNAKEC